MWSCCSPQRHQIKFLRAVDIHRDDIPIQWALSMGLWFLASILLSSCLSSSRYFFSHHHHYRHLTLFGWLRTARRLDDECEFITEQHNTTRFLANQSWKYFNYQINERSRVVGRYFGFILPSRRLSRWGQSRVECHLCRLRSYFNCNSMTICNLQCLSWECTLHISPVTRKKYDNDLSWQAEIPWTRRA